MSHFEGKPRWYSEIDHQAASKDMYTIVFQKKKLLKKYELGVPQTYFIKNFVFGKCFSFSNMIFWVIYYHFWAKENRFHASISHFKLLMRQLPKVQRSPSAISCRKNFFEKSFYFLKDDFPSDIWSFLSKWNRFWAINLHVHLLMRKLPTVMYHNTWQYMPPISGFST